MKRKMRDIERTKDRVGGRVKEDCERENERIERERERGRAKQIDTILADQAKRYHSKS